MADPMKSATIDLCLDEWIGDETFEICLVDLDLDVMFKFNGWTSFGMVQQKDGIIQCFLMMLA